jgi:nucleoside-diphosphate-sugar epimerase
MATALVTGAAGFVGRHFTWHLREQGWKVWAIDNRYARWLSDHQDARDFFAGSFSAFSFDLVVHCAAVVGGRQVIENDPMAQAVNFELDAAMFRWALCRRPGRVLYFSSSAAYPVHLQAAEDRHSLTETDITFFRSMGVPDQLYGWSKLTGEFLAARARERGLAVTVVRPFSGYGEDQDETYPFGAFIGRAHRREDPFLIWGDGRQVRDFIHIDDIVAACMVMYEREMNGPVNLCTGHPVSMRQLAAMVCAQAGYSPEFETCPSAPAGVPYRAGRAAELHRVRAPRVPLEEGIRRALKHRESQRALL